jgi:hypothetical protein
MNDDNNFIDLLLSGLNDACLVLVTLATGFLGYQAFVTRAIGF